VVSCSKDNTDEYATGNTQTGIVGKWKLVETRSDDGGGNIHVVDQTRENRIISFDSTGKTTDPQISCEGEYSFTPKEPGETLEPNLVISFECKTSNANIGNGPDRYFAFIRDNNYLSINHERCIETCAEIYRRLKD